MRVIASVCSDAVVVIGLGRFGSAVADSLFRLGHDVLAIDARAELVQTWSNRLTQVEEADGSDIEALRRLGVSDFDYAVVANGDDVEASVLAELALSELGVNDIWAKARTQRHG